MKLPTKYVRSRLGFLRALRKPDLEYWITSRKLAIETLTECYWVMFNKEKRTKEELWRIKEFIVSHPKKDIAQTIALLRINVLHYSDINLIYFSLVGAEFEEGDVNWAIHSQERPIHLFTDAIAKIMSFATQNIMDWNYTSVWAFAHYLGDRVAFKTLVRKAMMHGIAQVLIAQLWLNENFLTDEQRKIVRELNLEMSQPKKSLSMSRGGGNIFWMVSSLLGKDRYRK